MNSTLHRHHAASVVALAAWLLVACGSSAPPTTPTQGEWFGEHVSFHLEGGQLSGWSLQGTYCEVTGTEGSACMGLPSGAAGTTVALDGDSFEATFGDVRVRGTFVESEEAEGTWAVDASGCCAASGTWQAELIEALAPPDPEPGSGSGSGVTPDPGTGGVFTSAQKLCARWTDDRADLDEPFWTGDSASCTAGDIDGESRARVLRVVNLYRAVAGLEPVDLDEDYNALAQACSALMDANDTIEHMPPDTWDCYSYDGAKGASESNLATTPAVAAIDLYMGDTGNEDTMGHRRWILQNGLGPFGVGSTNEFSCLHVLGSRSVGPVPWTAWPPPGLFPIEAAFTLEPVGWSFHNHALESLENATVQVTNKGELLPVDTWPLAGGYGGSEALAFRPEGWSIQAGETYEVEIGGIASPVAYSVVVIDCGQP